MEAIQAIERQLQQKFSVSGEGGRVVIWSDPDKEYLESLDSLDLPNVNIIRVDNNEFAVKYKVLVTDKKSKFLIYRSAINDATFENWLLDMELAYGVFTADRASLILQELGDIDFRLRQVVEEYPAFFRASKRIDALRNRLEPHDSLDVVKAKMVAALMGLEDHTLQSIWHKLLEEHSQGKTTSIDEIKKMGLELFHWQGTARIYGYEAEQPTISDFVLWLFKLAWNGFVSSVPGQYRNIQIDFGHWSNDRFFVKSYRKLADQAVLDLAIDSQIVNLNLEQLATKFMFSDVDRQIIILAIKGIERRTLNDRQVQELTRSGKPELGIAISSTFMKRLVRRLHS